jgi:ankyrin repeat protein
MPLFSGIITCSTAFFEMPNDFLQAIENGDVRKVREFISADVDINAEDDDGDTALLIACWRGNKEIVELLLENGADVNYETDAYFYTALMNASGHGHAEIVRLLLNHGAKVNAEDDWQLTSLMRAAESGHLEVVRLLLEHGADASLRDDRGKTALELAEESGHSEVAEFIRRSAKSNGA